MSVRSRANRDARVALSNRNKLTKAMETYAPKAIKEAWVGEFHDDASAAFRALLTGSAHVCEHCHCERPNVHAVRLYCELAGAVGAQNQLIVSLHQSLGVRDERELSALIDGGRRLESLRETLAENPREILDSALEALAMVLGQHPKWRAEAARRVGSFAEAAEDATGSRDTNGTNGDAGL